MNRENYELLQVSVDATDEEVTEAYERLKKKYNEDKWLDGEAGTEAARLLGKIETAYSEIMEERRRSRPAGDGNSVFDEVSECIKKGDIARAQTLLDNFNERSAEWHYLQSVVFYKKNWMNESKKQLEIAIQMDPSNPKYREAHQKLNERADYQKQSGGATGNDANPTQSDEQMGGNWCASCANMCYTAMCINCCFNLCCNCR